MLVNQADFCLVLVCGCDLLHGIFFSTLCFFSVDELSLLCVHFIHFYTLSTFLH